MNIKSAYRRLALFVLLALPATGPLPAQGLYADIGSERKEVVFREDFNEMARQWPLPQAQMGEGLLLVSDRWNMIVPKTAQSFPIDGNRDFEIEVKAAPSSSVLPGQIHWNNYAWSIGTQSGNAVYQNGTQLKYLSDKLPKNSFHTFTIRRAGSTLYYFIDEKAVGSTYYSNRDFENNLLVGFSGKITVDELTVSLIMKPGQLSLVKTDDASMRDDIPAVSTKSNRMGVKPGGKYYGLFIGVSDYNEPRMFLPSPVKDAGNLKKLIVDRYNFADSNVFLLLNPTRQKIITELYRLRKVIGPNDNLLIFYAGHGFWDDDAKQGYWWAKDAILGDPSTWLSNSDLREQIRSIKSGHTLLISDACFSGGIFRTRGGNEIQNATRDIQMLYKLPSRRAMTSGTMTTVPDNSVFIQYLMKRLSENQSDFLSSQQLFDSIRTAVMNNSTVVPQDGVIAETGDEGGDFIFILKNK